MAARQVVAVIVHYGDPQRTIRAILSHWELGIFSDIVIVANDMRQRPAALGDIPCKWLVPSRNIGFGGACQLGATTTPADIYAFFNPHVTIDKTSVDRCTSAFDMSNVGISAPYLHHPTTGNPSVDWKFTHCLRTYSRILRMPIQVPLENGHVERKMSLAELVDNDWATGGVIFCREEVIRDIGWDGSYFLGYEDVDISIRAQQLGWRIVIVSSAIAFHTGESTQTKATSTYYGMRNPLWFARRYRDRRVQTLLTAYLLMLLCRVAAVDMLKRRRPPRARLGARGLLDGWLLQPVGTEALPEEPLWSRER